MSHYQYMDVQHPHQYQYHPAPPNHCPPPLSASHYYFPHHPPPDAMQYHGVPAPPFVPHLAGQIVNPMPAPPPRQPAHYIAQPQQAPSHYSPPVDTPSPESHCAFTFGWDFTQSDAPESDHQPAYTSSPSSSSSSSGKRQKLRDASASRRSNGSNRAHSAQGRSSHSAAAAQNLAAQYSSMPRTHLTDHAFGVIMQAMEGTHEPVEQPLSDLHRRLFPPNCHISYQQDSRM